MSPDVNATMTTPAKAGIQSTTKAHHSSESWNPRPSVSPAKAGIQSTAFILLVFLSALLFISGCSPRPRMWDGSPGRRSLDSFPSDLPNKVEVGATWVTWATYYGYECAGNNTASGEPFVVEGVSAAHRELPFGTVLEVENLNNNRKINVRVNDRGPFVEGRGLDLSLGAARELDMLREGLAQVRITIISLEPDE